VDVRGSQWRKEWMYAGHSEAKHMDVHGLTMYE
jgi:hypothetical protein